jgi:hypothetical protein
MSAVSSPGGNMPEQPLEIFKAYEDGKHRRYSLLFSVNGGAFAIAKVLADATPEAKLKVMGNLHVWQLSIGMLAFTILMVFDIYKFAEKMRSLQKNADPAIFKTEGKVVLLLIGTLICLGWLLAGLV